MLAIARRAILSTFLLAVLIATIVGCCDKDQIPQFSQGLYSSKAKIRNQSALDLAKCGNAASRSVPRLAELLYDENVGVQSSAAYALREIDTVEARGAIAKVLEVRKKQKALRN